MTSFTDEQLIDIINEAEEDLLKEVAAFLHKRSRVLYDAGSIHLRESVVLEEASMMIENGMWKE